MDTLNYMVNKLVIDGDIDAAHDLLEKEAPSFDNDVTLLKSSHAEMLNNLMSGTISEEDFRLEMNKLRSSILILVDLIDDYKKGNNDLNSLASKNEEDKSKKKS